MSLVSFISQEKQSSAQFPLRCVVADESRFEPQAPTTSASAVQVQHDLLFRLLLQLHCSNCVVL